MSRNYSRKTTPTGADLALIWDAANSDWRLTTITAIVALSTTDTTEGFLKEPLTQYAAPAATAFTILVNDDDEDVHLILTPAAAYATGAITLPATGTVRDKQRITVNCTKQVTAFSINANGATGVYGTPSSLAADDFFVMKYDVTLNSWYRVG